MMWRVLLAAWLAAALSLFAFNAPHAQFNGCPAGFCNPPKVATNSYVGPCSVSGITCLAAWALRGYTSSFSGSVANICDSATGLVCADATFAGGVLTLPTISAAACNNSTNVCEVKILYEQTGVIACATNCNATLGTNSQRPILVTSFSGSLPTMKFTQSATQTLNTNNLTAAINQPFTISSVSLQSSFVSRAYVAGQSTNVQAGYSASNTGIMYAGGAGPYTATTIDNQMQTIQYVFDGASSAMYIDKTNNALSGIGATGLASGTGFAIGDANGQGETLNGDIDEIIITTSSAASQTLCHNQQQYWGTTSTAC
jgi:hypothetical protein